MGFVIKQCDYINLKYSLKETEAVKLAILNLRRDLFRVLNCYVNENVQCNVKNIVIGSLDNKDFDISNKINLSILQDENGKNRKEAFLIQEKENVLYIIGTDRRGTIYGIYDLCQNQLGVSPWYFFADVPVKEKSEIFIESNFIKVDYPSVEYRGIFINDEEELEHWVQRYMGEETIGVKTYEKIFELLLRLKLNYIWPAMHVNSFNMKRENGALADKMGIVVGTSHCDMLMRSNNREWKPWLKQKGYTDIEYDYSIPGRNREVLEEYWRDSVEQNKDFEVSYTLGMRGIHDSGFNTKFLAGKKGEELLKGKIELLDSVIKAQEKMLDEGLEKETLKTFVPYKEVLELYDNGLEIPEDLTLIWVNDNYGYIRRYPGEKEKQRKGGNGIYYHNSYWAPPGNSYLFICSIPLSHTRNELKKAYEEGIRKIWVTNFGAIKPLEQQLTFYAAYAWEVGKENALTDNEQLFLEKWIDQTFSGNYGKELSVILTEFDQITNVRKLEHMESDVFSQIAYGDEAADRIHKYEKMFEKVNQIYKELPLQERDAFYQLVVMKIHAAYYTNSMYYYADRSNLCIKQGKHSAADKYTRLCKEFDHARRKMLYYYNHIMANGKWNGILTPEDFPPPRTAMYPACVPPLKIGDKELIVTLWNDDDKIVFTEAGKKWFELANAGLGEFLCEITIPKGLSLYNENLEFSGFKDAKTAIYKLKVSQEERILIKLKNENFDEFYGKEFFISIKTLEDGKIYNIPVIVSSEMQKERISIEAESEYKNCNGWNLIPNLGRGKGALLEGRKENAEISYTVNFKQNGKYLLELHRFPTLNSIGRIRIGVTIDDKEMQILESNANDEKKGNWKSNVQNNVDKLYLNLPEISAGSHKITFKVIDKYFAFTRFVIYTKDMKENSLGYEIVEQTLPKEIDIDRFTEDFYGKIKLKPRKVLYLSKSHTGDTLVLDDIFTEIENCGEKVLPMQLIEKGNQVLTENNGNLLIELSSAMAQSEYAYTDNYDWDYCNAPSYGETGLAMYIRKKGLRFKEDMENIPTLNYKVNLSGGKYIIWVKTFSWGNDESHFTLGFDGKIILEKELYGGKRYWCYANEHVWKWIPIYSKELEHGEHLLSIYSLASGMRFEQMYVTKGEELPPALV